MSLKIANLAYRAGEILGAASAAPSDSGGERDVTISFSSESPFRRFEWDREEEFLEVLGHKADEVDLSRLNSGAAPLLKDHRATIDNKIGSVVRAWLEGGRCHALVRFSDTPEGRAIHERVQAGEITCVSVGYGITRAIRAGEQDGTPIIRATRWHPKEISFVAIPADPSVGYGRDDYGAAQSLTVTEKETPDMAKDTIEPKIETPPAQVRSDDTPPADPVAVERSRSAEIRAIGRQFPDLPAEMVTRALDKGTDVGAFRQQVMDHIASDEVQEQRTSATRIGLSSGEVSAFSISNAVRFLMNPNDRNREAAAFELEASRAVGDAIGREAEGIFIPSDVLMDGNFARAQNTGTPAQGGVLVAQDYRGGSFIELLRNRMALTGRGVRLLQGLSGNVDIPKQTGGGTFYWFGEDGEPTDTEAGFGLTSMTPHSAGMAIPYTRRMAQQASLDIEALVRDDLLRGMALGLDQTALVGHSSPDAPDGLRDKIFANALNWADSAAMPDEDDLIDLETAVAVANADVGDLAYIYNAQMSGHLKKLRDADGRRLDVEKNGMTNDYPRVRTNQAGAGEAFFGNWSDLIIGMWSGLDLRVDRSTKAASDGKVLRVFTDVDTAVRNLESFKLGKPESTTS
ncbi:phage major capsid protein [Tropicibacter sp. R15_0]|uniref:phage major capsid protein n=1 Tax=Tropicibacter sp. R15_0 TaxID=2821101 RepID=UPI001AD964F6|nr:phage major capsid protein [Tropicibacter sp. R15_0]MBO9467057.1 phage major capsid protein [Tropicibacter sp. R15_0]